MARTISFEGRLISVPDDATDDEVASIISSSAPAPSRGVPAVEPETMTDRVALQADKILKTMGSALPDFLPSRQAMVDVAAGATSLPRGALNLAKEGLGEQVFPSSVANKDSGAYLAGSIADPFAMATGMGTAKVLTALPKVGSMFAKGGYESLKGKSFVEGAKSLGRNIASGGTIGATVAGLTDEGNALTGGMLGAVLPAIPAVGRTAQAVTGPLRESWRTEAMRSKLRETLGQQGMDDIAEAIASRYKPGMSVGDIIADMNIDRTSKVGSALVKLEQQIGAHADLSDIAKTKAATEAAGREAAITSFAKTPEAIAAAEGRRGAVTGPMREEALSGATGARVPFEKLNEWGAWGQQTRPALTVDSVKSAVDSVKNREGFKTNTTVQSAMDEVGDLLKKAVTKEGGASAAELYTIRKQSGNIIKKYAQENKDWDERLTSGLLSDVQKSIDESIENALGNSGQWNRYLEVFSKRSQGINQMKIGQELLKALRGETGNETPAAFGAKVRKLEDELETKLSPAQQSRVNAVLASLRTGQEKKSLAAGVNTGTFSEVGKGGQMPHMLTTTGTIVNQILALVGQEATGKISKDVGKLMLTDPDAFARKYLKNVSPEEVGPIVNALRGVGGFKYPAIAEISSE